jgi:hypothetical protein
MTPPVQISTWSRIAAYGFSRKVGGGHRLPQAGCEDYIINDAALDYMRHRKVAPDVIGKLAAHPETSFAS